MPVAPHRPPGRAPLPQAAVKHLLPEIKPQDASKLCVVIDLDETLVHSSFKVGALPLGWEGGLRATGAPHPTLTPLCTPQPVNNADFIIPVEIDGIMHQVRGCAVRGWEEWGVWWGAPPKRLALGSSNPG